MKAPVVVFSFNRADNLESLLYSLSLCEYANETIVYLYIDGARNEEDKENQLLFDNIIAEVQCSFLELIVTKKDINVGLRKSLIQGITNVLSEYDNVIVLEDDLTLSPNFLCYMNDSLEFYKNNEEVASISGYTNYISTRHNKDNYFHLRPCSWGWATWKNRWEVVDWDYKPVSLKEWFFLWLKCKPVGDDIFRMFRNLHSEKINSWAISWTIHNIRNKRFTSYPYVSKVSNDGFGDMATHCISDNPFITNFKKSNKKSFYLLKKIRVNKKEVFKFNLYFSNWYKLIFKLGFRLKKKGD